MLPAVQAALSVRPKQLYGVNRSTITSVLLTTDALPGGLVEWEPLLDVSAPPYTAENGFSALAAIPFQAGWQVFIIPQFCFATPALNESPVLRGRYQRRCRNSRGVMATYEGRPCRRSHGCRTSHEPLRAFGGA